MQPVAFVINQKQCEKENLKPLYSLLRDLAEPGQSIFVPHSPRAGSNIAAQVVCVTKSQRDGKALVELADQTCPQCFCNSYFISESLHASLLENDQVYFVRF